MQVTEKLLTADEFMLLPEPIEGGKMELVEGRVVTMPPVGEQHGRGASKLDRVLGAFAERHKLGIVTIETGFRLRSDPDLVRAPDVSFVANERLDPGRDRSKYVEGPPTLAVEVASPGDRDQDIAEKVLEYLAAGTQRVWVVRPRTKTVTVHLPGGDAHTYSVDDTLTSADAGFGVEGFSLALGDLFG